MFGEIVANQTSAADKCRALASIRLFRLGHGPCCGGFAMTSESGAHASSVAPQRQPVVFFEKPGCANNARQKAWLLAAGHSVEARDLLRHPWSREELLAYLDELPVSEWFNRASPKLKSGEVNPASLTRQAALDLLLGEPLLIRRPLLRVGERRAVGFDVARIHAWLGLPEAVVRQFAPHDAERCVHAPEEGHQ
jgi:nitrogenase-associated protein